MGYEARTKAGQEMRDRVEARERARRDGQDLGDDPDGDLEGYDGPLDDEAPDVAAVLVEARRTLAKAEGALQHAEQYFQNKDAMNAAQHLSGTVLTSPLHSEVTSVLQAIDRFKRAHPE